MGIFSSLPSAEELFEEFDRIGEDEVRLELQQRPGWPSFYDYYRKRIAARWLSTFERAARLRAEDAQADSLQTAKSARDAAWASAKAAEDALSHARNANTISAVSLAVSIIAIALTIVGLFLRGR